MSSASHTLKVFIFQRLPHLMFMSFFVALAFYAGMVFQRSGAPVPTSLTAHDRKIVSLLAPLMILGLLSMQAAPAIKRDKNLPFGVVAFLVGGFLFFLMPIGAMQVPDMQGIASLTVAVVSIGFVIVRVFKVHQPMPHESWTLRERRSAPSFVVNASMPKRPNRSLLSRQSTPSGSIEEMLGARMRGNPSPGLPPVAAAREKQSDD